jgi:hypothetical protein
MRERGLDQNLDIVAPVREFNSRWDYQTNQAFLLPAPLALGKYSTARLDAS